MSKNIEIIIKGENGWETLYPKSATNLIINSQNVITSLGLLQGAILDDALIALNNINLDKGNFIVGQYNSTGESFTLQVGFKPSFFAVTGGYGGWYSGFAVRPATMVNVMFYGSNKIEYITVSWNDRSIFINAGVFTQKTGGTMGGENKPYSYIVLG